MTIYFLGGGNMAAAIIGGLRQQQPDAAVHVANRGEEKRARLAAEYGVAVSEKLPKLSAEDVLVLAVKPQDMQAACAGLDTCGALVLSVAAGLSVATLQAYLGGTRRIIRIQDGLIVADSPVRHPRRAGERAYSRSNGDLTSPDRSGPAASTQES